MPSYDKPARCQHFSGPLYEQMAEHLQLTGKAQRILHGYLRIIQQYLGHSSLMTTIE